MEGVDYAFSNPTAIGLAAAGKRFAMRYVGPGTSPKHLTVSEAKTLQAAGLSLVLLVEGAEDSFAGGRAVGRSHARQAVDMCKARGFPTNRPFYFAIDKDINTATWPAAAEYLRGAAEVIGLPLVGAYGEHDAMVWAARDRVASWFFQTYAWSDANHDGVVSGSEWFAGNHVEQYRNNVTLAGGQVDLCRSIKADFGQWPIQSTGGSTDMIFAISDGPHKNAAGRAGGGAYQFAKDGAQLERWRKDQGGVATTWVTQAEFADRVGVLDVTATAAGGVTEAEVRAIFEDELADVELVPGKD